MYVWVALADSVFWHGQLFGTLIAFIFNFYINNKLTFSDARLRSRGFFIGMMIFALVSLPGIIANVSLANYINDTTENIAYLASLSGILIDTV